MFSIFLGIYLGEELLGPIVMLHWNFWEVTELFSKVAVPFHIPSSNVWEFQFPHSPPNICYCLPHYSHPIGYKVVLYYDFDLYFPNYSFFMLSFTFYHLILCISDLKPDNFYGTSTPRSRRVMGFRARLSWVGVLPLLLLAVWPEWVMRLSQSQVPHVLNISYSIRLSWL